VRRRGLVLAITVMLLAAPAAILAASVLSQARELAAGSGSPSAEASPSASPSSEPTVAPTPDPTPASTPEPTPEPTPAPTPGPIAGWQLAGTFGNHSDMLIGAHDLATWNGQFLALGESWEYDDVGGARPEPWLWRSTDGLSWSEQALDLGPGASVHELAALPDGSIMVLGSVGGSIVYWSEPARPAAWTSLDAITWTRVSLPFGEEVQAPIRYAAGGRGLVATIDDWIWHSTDGRTWRPVHHVPRGQWVYEPVAGDEGWIVKHGNASLGTTTLLVSGDAVTWYEVDLGNVATVSNVAGDWLASRHSDDWERTEILRSANGLDWEVVLDLATLPPPADVAEEFGAFDGARMTGTDEMTLLSPYQAGHCFSMPSGYGVWWSSDSRTWVPVDLTEGAVIMHAAELGDVSVLAGYLADRGGVAFWTSTR
jgi:hypothetical protein